MLQRLQCILYYLHSSTARRYCSVTRKASWLYCEISTLRAVHPRGRFIKVFNQIDTLNDFSTNWNLHSVVQKSNWNWERCHGSSIMSRLSRASATAVCPLRFNSATDRTPWPTLASLSSDAFGSLTDGSQRAFVIDESDSLIERCLTKAVAVRAQAARCVRS